MPVDLAICLGPGVAEVRELIPHFKEGRDIFVHRSRPTMAR